MLKLSYSENIILNSDLHLKMLGLVSLKNFSDQNRVNLEHGLDDFLLSCSLGGMQCNSSNFY